MATNCTFEWSGSGDVAQNSAPSKKGHGGSGSAQVTKVVSMADVVVKTSPTQVGTFNTATVTADLAPGHVMAASDGVPPGYYERVGTALFRRQ